MDADDLRDRPKDALGLPKPGALRFDRDNRGLSLLAATRLPDAGTATSAAAAVDDDGGVDDALAGALGALPVELITLTVELIALYSCNTLSGNCQHQ